MVKIFIIGGGITGLNLARELAKNNIKVILFESSNHYGGLAGYTTAFNRNLDLGPHIFHTPDPEIAEYLRTSFPGLFYERVHYSKNLKNGRYYDYPISREFINSLEPVLRDKINQELLNRNLEDLCNAKNYYDYIGIIAGETLREIFFTQYPEKLWGLSTKELDANWAPKRVEIREKITPFYSGQWAAVGNDGTSSIINHLVNECIELGVELKKNEPIVSIEKYNNRIIALESNKKNYIVNNNDIIVNTTSLTSLSKIFDCNTSLNYRGVILVYIHTSNIRPFPENTDFIYIDDKKIIFNRISDQNSFVIKKDLISTVLCCEITYSKEDVIDLMSDEDLISRVNADIISLNIIDFNEILGNHIVRLPEVYPMYTLDYRNALSVTKSEMGKFSNLYSLGSLAEFAYSDLQILFAKSRDFAKLLCGETSRSNRLLLNKPKINFKTEVEVFNRKIGDSHPCFTIGEIGLNHNGSVDVAKKLIDSAINAGFDAVKLQSYVSEGRSSKNGNTSKYVEKVLQTEETDFEMFSKYELNIEQTADLFRYAKSLGMPIFSAPFDILSANNLNNLGVSAFKIASMEITNLDLLKVVAAFKKPIILSSGMSTLGDIELALSTILSEGNDNVILLHCTSVYPCPPIAVNLRNIETLKKAFNLPVGFSDHYHSDLMSMVSLAMGASVIEKHITLDRRMEGPDHALSLEPLEQIEFIKNIRNVELGMGTSVKQFSYDEMRSEVRFRKSYYFINDMEIGDVIQNKDIELKAPCIGLLPVHKHFILNNTIKEKVKSGDPVEMRHVIG